MEKDEELMDNPVFPSRNVQRILLRVSYVSFTEPFQAFNLLLHQMSTDNLWWCMQQALPPDIVVVIIFLAARWLQEGLTSHDLLLACANGSIPYVPTFREVCSQAEEDLNGYPLRDFLIPKGTQDDLYETHSELHDLSIIRHSQVLPGPSKFGQLPFWDLKLRGPCPLLLLCNVLEKS